MENLLDYIHLHRGRITIQMILVTFNVGYKRLERLFKRLIGLTPKAYCRLIRFNAAIYFYEKYPEDNLTQLAYTTGHFDQMHFIKEIKRFTTFTPAQLLATPGLRSFRPENL